MRKTGKSDACCAKLRVNGAVVVGQFAAEGTVNDKNKYRSDIMH
jgi:hypothetical protein